MDLGNAGPADSLIRANDDALYIGLRHYVLGVQEAGDHIEQMWFAPSGCISLQET